MRSLKLLALSFGLVFATLVFVSCQGTPTRATSSVSQTPAETPLPASSARFAPLNPYAECPYHPSRGWRP